MDAVTAGGSGGPHKTLHNSDRGKTGD